MPSCHAFVSPDTVLFVGHGGGGTVPFRVGVPNRPGLAGLALGTQALLLDPTATNTLRANIMNLTGGRAGT
jgi:hypothetical protein